MFCEGAEKEQNLLRDRGLSVYLAWLCSVWKPDVCCVSDDWICGTGLYGRGFMERDETKGKVGYKGIGASHEGGG